jgi:hypothetical protein
MDERRRRSGSLPAARTMRSEPNPGPGPSRSTIYRIRVRGHLDDRWPAWAEGLVLTRDERGDTILTVPIADQAALYGLLRRLRDLGVPLVSVNPAGPVRPGATSKEEMA